MLLLEPDLGAAIVLVAVAFAMMFVAGARFRDFFVFAGLALAGAVVMVVTRQYRLERITGFMDPWADPYDKGFQLTQSLIAIGRGEWFGVGLGDSVQKLFYLPDAHTDFVFAVYAEEFGLFGSCPPDRAVRRALVAHFCARPAGGQSPNVSSRPISPSGSAPGSGCRPSSTSA